MLKLAFAFALGYLLRSVIAQVENRRIAAEIRQRIHNIKQALGLEEKDE